MAMQAGRVGVDPRDVTLDGRIKGGGDVPPNVLTKEEAARIYQTIANMAYYLTKTEGNNLYQKISDMVDYQLKLVSGINIKRINGEDLLGSGNIQVLTNEIASGIYQTIQGMSNYVLKSELPTDLSDLLTKTEAPGYNDILTRTSAISLLNNKLSLDGTSITIKDTGDDVNDLISGMALYPPGCVNTPEGTSTQYWLVLSAGNSTYRVQIAFPNLLLATDYMIMTRVTTSGDSNFTSWYENLKLNGILSSKQDKLTAGTGIVISNNVISNKYPNLSNIDLNNINYLYLGQTQGNCTNLPVANTGGQLINIPRDDGAYRFQMFSRFSNDDIYTRKYNNGTWTAWSKLTNSYMVGDTVSNVGSQYPTLLGLCTNNKQIEFVIPLSKPINANSISFSNLTTRIWDKLGSVIVDRDVVADTSYTVSSSIVANVGIKVQVVSNTAVFPGTGIMLPVNIRPGTSFTFA